MVGNTIQPSGHSNDLGLSTSHVDPPAFPSYAGGAPPRSRAGGGSTHRELESMKMRYCPNVPGCATGRRQDAFAWSASGRSRRSRETTFFPSTHAERRCTRPCPRPPGVTEPRRPGDPGGACAGVDGHPSDEVAKTCRVCSVPCFVRQAFFYSPRRNLGTRGKA